MNYDNIFLFLFLMTIVVLSFMLFHKQLAEPTTLLVSSQYYDVSDKELNNKIKALDNELNISDKNISIAAAKMRSNNYAAKQEYMFEINKMKELLRVRRSYINEKTIRAKKLRWAFGIAFIVCLVIFIDLNRRVILYRDPRRRKKLRIKKQMAKWDKIPKTERPTEVALENTAAPPPGIFPGKTTMENIVHLIGEPHQRSTFQGLEVWIYFLEPGYIKEKIGITELPPPQELENQTGHPDAQRLIPLSIIFRSHIAQNYALAKIDDAAGMQRFL
jgi:hypothetical protein